MRYFRLWKVFLTNCLIREMGFRANFILGILGNLLSFSINILFFGIIYLNVQSIGGWDVYRTLILVSTCQIINLLYSALFGGIANLTDYVKGGSLDFILLKPLDPQLLISLRYVNLQSFLSLAFPCATIVYVAHLGKIAISFSNLLLYIFLLLCGLLLRYALGFIIMASSLWVVRIDALYALYNYIASLAQYPMSIYKGGVRILFTFVIPIIVIANFPALSLKVSYRQGLSFYPSSSPSFSFPFPAIYFFSVFATIQVPVAENLFETIANTKRRGLC